MEPVFATYGEYILRGTLLKANNRARTWNVAGATAIFESGPEERRVTAGRVALMGVFALAAQKDHTRVFARLELADGNQLTIEGPRSDESKLRAFVAKVNQAARAS